MWRSVEQASGARQRATSMVRRSSDGGSDVGIDALAAEKKAKRDFPGFDGDVGAFCSFRQADVELGWGMA